MQQVKLNPFPGLRSFDYEEHHLFFGREKHISDLLKKLLSHHFVAVVGTSGSGKSSLIRAGLLPSIHAGMMAEGQEEWFIASMKPGTTPLSNLSSGIAETRIFGSDDERAVEQPKLLSFMQKSSLGLVQGVRSTLTGNKRLLILVDQFEELFRYRVKGNEHLAEEANAFVKLIIDTISQKDVPVYVVLTLRSDFLGDCVSFEGLPEAINDGHYLVPRLNRDQNKAAITGPIEFAGGKISPRLIQALINDLGDDPDQLPVLQHAMMRTWDYWVQNSEPGEPMDIQHYNQIGGMKDALTVHADEAYNELNGEKHRKLIEDVFKIITVKSSERGTRRPTTVEKVLSITGASLEDLNEALKPFRRNGRTFILPEQDHELTPESVLDISHESLMRGWKRLNQWVDEEMNSAEVYRRLCSSAVLYNSGQSGLYRDPELQLALDWKAKYVPNSRWAQQYNSLFEQAEDFLKLSVSERDKEIKRKNRRRTMLRSAVAAFLVIVSTLTIWALFQTNAAQRNSKLAEQKTTEAVNQKQLAEKAKEMALAASKEALDAKSFAELQSDIAVEQKKLALEQKIRAQEQALLATNRGDEALRQKLLADQQRLEAIKQKQLAEKSEQDANRLRMISIGQNLTFRSIQQEDAALSGLLASTAYNMIFNNSGNTFDPQLYNALSQALQKNDPGYKNQFIKKTETVLAIGAGPETIQTISKSGIYEGFNLSGSKSVSNAAIPNLPSALNTAYFSKNGDYLLLGFETNLAQVYSVNGTPALLHTLAGHRQLVRAADFADKANVIATGGRDSMVILWTGGTQSRKWKLNSRIRFVRFNSDHSRLFAGTEAGTIYLIDLKSDKNEITVVLNEKGSRALAMDVTSDYSLFAASFSNGVLHILNQSGSVVSTIKAASSIDFVGFDASNKYVTIITSLKKIGIYDLSHPAMRPIEIISPANVTDFVANTGDAFVVSCADNSIRKYLNSTTSLYELLSKKTSRILTEEEWNTFVGQDIPYNKTSANNK